MTEVLSEVIEYQSGYFSEGWQYPMFAVSLFGLLVLWQRRTAAKVTLYTVIMLFIIYCPLTAEILLHFMGDGVYWRMFWLLPIIPVTGVFMVEFLPRVVQAAEGLIGGEKSRKAVGVVAGIVVIAIYAGLLVGGGHFAYSDGNILRAGNLEKLPPDIVDMCDAINADAAEHPELTKKVASVGNPVPFIRQYDATIGMAYGRQTIWNGRDGDHRNNKKYKLYWELSNEENPDYDKLRDLIDKNGCDYVLILDEGYVTAGGLEEQGFDTVYDNGSYTLLRRR